MSQPKEFVPYAYQKVATRFLLEHDRCALHVDLGMGKTLMVLAALDALILCGDDRPFLIVAPLRVARSVWSNEAKQWREFEYMNIVPIVGTPKERLSALNTEAHGYTVNFENLVWLTEQHGKNWPYRTVVVDEASKLKAHRSYFRTKKDGTKSLICTGGARTTALAKTAFKNTKRFWELTGTPALGGLTDLWPQFWFLDAGKRLGSSFSAFTDRWYKLGFNGYDLTILPHAENEIREAISDITFTLQASDYLKLGSEITKNLYIDLPSSARALYKRMEKELFMEIRDKEIEAFSAAARGQKLHQIANGAAYTDDAGSFEFIHDAKIEMLASVIEEAAGTPLIVAYHFQSDLRRLLKAFPKGKALGKSGAVEAEFKEGKVPILFLHPASAGHGINDFQYVTNIICFFSLDWSAENRLQAIGRIGAVRQFQAKTGKPTFIYNIVARDTIDDDILLRIESKVSVESALRDGLARRNLA